MSPKNSGMAWVPMVGSREMYMCRNDPVVCFFGGHNNHPSVRGIVGDGFEVLVHCLKTTHETGGIVVMHEVS